MRKLKYCIIALIINILLINFGAYSQNKFSIPDTTFKQEDLDRLVYVENFDTRLLEALAFSQLNKQMLFNNKEALMQNKILRFAAEDQAEFMAGQEDARLEQSGKKLTTLDRVQYYGGARNAVEFVMKLPAANGKDPYTYKQMADEIVFKWFNTKKCLDLLSNPKYIFCGIGAKLDYNGKKIYVSLVLGNYQSMNYGANRKGELEVPYNNKLYGLWEYDDKMCRNCNKYKNVESLADGLFVRDGKIYFKHDNIKDLKKLIRKPKDGLAVDVVQREQYTCAGDNILDNNLFNKGILLKRVYAPKLYKKNLIEGKRVKKLEVQLGTLPSGIKGDYELNLLIIQDKFVCRNISKPYMIEAGVEYAGNVEMLADTVTINAEKDWSPAAEKSSLSFRIPFDRNKFTYKPEDIEPFVKSLNEPDFIIDKVKISAYSSIEGNDNDNKVLQQKRAESIIDALNNRQKGNAKIKTEIFTDENWADFKTDILSTAYSKLAEGSLEDAKQYIKDNRLQKDLESILAKHRYAQIYMNVTYDIGGKKEEAYVLSRFNKAVKANDKALALSIQKFIFKKILKGEYSNEAVNGEVIPSNATNVGLLMNKVWLEKYINNEELDEAFCEKINALYQLDGTNPYVQFNKIYCHILNEPLGDDNQIQEYQDKINELYFSTLSKKTVDNLNLEFQFKIIETLDTLDSPHPLTVESLNRIKEIIDMKESTWQNSLKLAYMFMKQNDYDFAAKLLEPYIETPNVFEEVVFTYISACSYTQYRLYTSKFVTAMKKASELNPDRFCKLLNGKQLTFQVLENDFVKEVYCKTCKK